MHSFQNLDVIIDRKLNKMAGDTTAIIEYNRHELSADTNPAELSTFKSSIRPAWREHDVGLKADEAVLWVTGGHQTAWTISRCKTSTWGLKRAFWTNPHKPASSCIIIVVFHNINFDCADYIYRACYLLQIVENGWKEQYGMRNGMLP